MKAEIERRANLSHREFTEEYLYPNRPVIVTDAIRQWKAVARWTPEFFKTEFRELTFTINDRERGQTGYKAKGNVEYTMERFIDRVLDSTDETPAPYFRNRVLYETFPTLREDIEPLPGYYFPNWLPESFWLPKVQSVFNRGAQIEIYIGGRGGAFPVLHYDGLASHAFLVQIYGQKKFIIYSPEQKRNMYPVPGQPNISQIADVEHPDLERFPLFGQAEAVSFVLDPGEVLFIPSRWWHATKMLTPCISISTNVVNQSNWAALTDFVANNRNPLMGIPSRAYLNLAGFWRSMRDRRIGFDRTNSWKAR